jgi:MoxR-like ATPase
VARYVARLVVATHPGSPEATEEVGSYVQYGASPRAAIALAEAARAEALLAGRPTAGFDDVRRVAFAVLNHRMILDYRARLEGVRAAQIVEDVLASTEEVEMALPDDVAVGHG